MATVHVYHRRTANFLSATLMHLKIEFKAEATEFAIALYKIPLASRAC